MTLSCLCSFLQRLKIFSRVCILFYSFCFTGLIQTTHLPLRVIIFNDTNGIRFCVTSTFRTLHPCPLLATSSVSVMVTSYKLILYQKICKAVVIALLGFQDRQVVFTQERFLYEAHVGAPLTMMHVWIWSITMFFLLPWCDHFVACDKVCVRVLGFCKAGI